MKTRNKIIILALVTGTLASGTAYAEVSDFSVSKNFKQGTVSVSGIAEKGDIITIQVLPLDITPEMIQENPEFGKKTVYCITEEVNEEGFAEFEFELNPGNYMLYMASDVKGDLHKRELVFVSENAYSDIIKELKKADKDEFLSLVETNKNVLGFDIENYSSDAVLRFRDEFQDELSEIDSEKNVNNFRKCVFIEEFDKLDAVSYIKEIYKDETELLGFIDEYVNKDVEKEYFEDKLSSVKNTEELEDCIKEALILTVVKYSGETEDIKKMMTEYKSLLGISSVTDYASVYRAISGKDYDDVSDFLDAYKDALAEKNETISGGGGGGSSSGKGNSKPSSVISAPVAFPSEAGQMKDVPVFYDIDSVSWAKESIEELYKKGIVNGKENQMFYPADKVKREEFVKMLVLTFGMNLDGKNMEFSDVSEGAWYYEYINTAFEAEIINGVGNNVFGVGQNITRQDICVMIYRALTQCDVEIPNVQSIEFKDAGNVADYAKEAVLKMAEAGVVNGDDLGNFNPQSFATRAETAKMLYGILNIIERG